MILFLLDNWNFLFGPILIGELVPYMKVAFFVKILNYLLQ